MVKDLNYNIKKTIFDSNNLELIKNKYYHKFYGVKQGFDFLTKMSMEIKKIKHLEKSDVPITGFSETEVVVYDILEKNFLVFEREKFNMFFLNYHFSIYQVIYGIHHNKIYYRLYEILIRTHKKFNYFMTRDLFNLANILSWFLADLRFQLEVKGFFSNEFSISKMVSSFPCLFFEVENLEEDHKEFILSFINELNTSNVIKICEDKFFFKLEDLQELIHMIYANFEIFNLSNDEMYKTGFELDDRRFLYIEEKLLEIKNKFPNLDESNFLFKSSLRDLKNINSLDIDYIFNYNDMLLKNDYLNIYSMKLKINNIIYAYIVSSAFDFIALSKFSISNSLYSEFFYKKYLINSHNKVNSFWHLMNIDFYKK